jgi:hypothetical protein
MNAIHIVFHSRKKLFLVDANEVEVSPLDSRPTLKTFLDELNTLQKKARLNLPWWFWVILALYCASFVLFIIFIWYIVIACTVGLVILVSILLVYKRRSWRRLREEVASLCANYQSTFRPYYMVKNYFNSNEIPPDEHDLEGLAILLLPLSSDTGATTPLEREHMRMSNRELGGTHSNFDTDNQDGLYPEERRSERRIRASRQERKSRVSSKQFINLDTYITSERFLMSTQTIPSFRDLENAPAKNQNREEAARSPVTLPKADNKRKR